MATSLFLLLMLMEFKRSRVVTKQSSSITRGITDDEIKNKISSAIEPELEVYFNL